MNKEWYEQHAIESALKATEAHERGDMTAYKMHSQDAVNYERRSKEL